MRVTLIAVGTRGDVQPFLALGTSLVRSGHRVHLVSHASAADLAARHGFEFTLIPVEPRDVAQSPIGKQWVESGRSVIGGTLAAIRAFTPLVECALDPFLAACEGADIVIYADLAILAQQIAEYCGALGCTVHFTPHYITSESPHYMFQPRPFGGWYNRATYYYEAWCGLLAGLLPLNGPSLSSVLGKWAKSRLGEGLRMVKEDLFIGAYSSLVVPAPSDWPPHAKVTGYWTFDQYDEPSAEAKAFVERGEKPICVGLGSMVGANPEQVTNIVISALQRTKKRAVLLTNWGGLDENALRQASLDVHVAESLPHDWLFPQVSGVFHHGGAGTTAAALRAGVPSCAIPYYADQWFWGGQLARLGAGLDPIPKNELTVDKLVAAIERITTDVEVRARAEEMKSRLSRENGCLEAVQLIEQTVAKGPKRVAKSSPVTRSEVSPGESR